MSRPAPSALPRAGLPCAVRALLGILALAGCEGDSLYSENGVTGPHQAVAPHTVSVSVPEQSSIALGEGIPVRVSYDGGAGRAGVVRVGATALVLTPGSGDTTVLRAATSFPAPQAGAGSVTLTLLPTGIDPRLLPATRVLEVHGFAVSGSGACAAAVEGTSQRLACGTFRGDTVAYGVTGRRAQVSIVTPHSVQLTAQVSPRVAQNDTLLRATLVARSTAAEGGITRVGITGLVRDRAGALVAVLRDSAFYSPGRPGTVTQTFAFSMDDLRRAAGGRALPDSVSVEVFGWALHQSGACVAATTDDTEQRLGCGAGAGGERIAVGARGRPTEVVLVQGRTAPLPSGARIADIVVDPRGGHVFLSDLANHRVEVLDLETLRYRAPVLVGSRPMGLSLNRAGDTLIVANSGGINVSFVSIASMREDVERRLEIPRVRLYEFNSADFSDAIFYSYTDRPSYVAQDAQGRLLYSTITTVASPVGTVRLADYARGWDTWEPHLLFHERALNRDSLRTSVANVDSLQLTRGGIRVFDHVPGFPDRVIEVEAATLTEALQELREEGSDIVVYRESAWNLDEAVELSDTGFVVASEDRRVVLFGEGVRTPAGRMIVWVANPGELSEVEDIHDITINTSDRILDIDLNRDGSLGAARGERGVYFFGTDLRLRGSTTTGLAGGTGVAFLPGVGGTRTHAFAGTARQSVQVIETTHFRPIGEIPIPATLTRSMRVVGPGPAENQGLACSGDLAGRDAGCIVARIVGEAEGGRVVVVEVRAGDIQRMQP